MTRKERLIQELEKEMAEMQVMGHNPREWVEAIGYLKTGERNTPLPHKYELTEACVDDIETVYRDYGIAAE